MAEQPENTRNEGASNENLYPYSPIQLSLKDLLSRFGEKLGTDYVPIVLKWGTKKPFWDNWQTLSWAELDKLELYGVPYLDRLCQKNGDHNIGIRLGPNSGHLVGIDVDTDDCRVTDQLVSWNPFLDKTLWTRGAHGHQMWLRIKGDYPAEMIYLSPPGISGHKPDSPAVEIRASDGHQSVVWGKHPDGNLYSVVKDFPILEIEWSQLHWEWPEHREKKERASRKEGRWINRPLEWQADKEKRTRIVDELYEVISASDDGHRLDIVCCNNENHSDDTGERQTSIYLGTDERGTVAYTCFHASCREAPEGAWSVNRRETERLKLEFARAECVHYEQGGNRIHETQGKAYQLMAETGQFFSLNETVAWWREGWEKIDNISSLTVHTALSENGIKVSRQNKGNIGPFRLLGEEASSLLANKPYINAYLPKIRAIAPCSLYYASKTDQKGVLSSYGYNPEIEYLNLSKEPIELMAPEQGKEFLHEYFLKFFEFETPADYSRAFATLLSPALLLGHWFEGRSPAFLVVADKRQAGKTFFLKLLAAMYNHELILQEYLERSIGGVIERLCHELGRGAPFFAIDNIRGAPDLPFIEIFTTGGREVQFRGAYEKMRYADTTRMTLFMCGNEGFKIPADLGSRCVIPKMLYKAGRNWRLEDGVTLAAKIQHNWPTYLGAICGILAGWAQKGALRVSLTPEEIGPTDLRFIDWHESQNGIGQMLGLTPLGSGLAERQVRASDNTFSFSEAAFSLLKEVGALNQVGTAAAFAHFFEDDETVGLPFKYKGDRSLQTRMGLLLSRLPTAGENVNQFGPGFVHIRHDNRGGITTYLFSETIQYPTETKEFDYAF